MSQHEMISEIKSVIRDIMPEDAHVLLYGSRARGDAYEESDWDVLILLNKDIVNGQDFDEVAYPLVELGWRYGESINPTVYSQKEWEKRSFTPFYKNVEQDSISLWH